MSGEAITVQPLYDSAAQHFLNTQNTDLTKTKTQLYSEGGRLGSMYTKGSLNSMSLRQQ